MPTQQVLDSTNNSFGFVRDYYYFRPLPGSSFPAGALCSFPSMDNQVFFDGSTVQPSATSAANRPFAGVVSEDFAGATKLGGASNEGGFAGTGGVVAPSATARGTRSLKLITFGYHPSVLIDNSGAGNATIAHGTPLTNSTASTGRAMGTAAPVVAGILGNAMLPAAGLFSSLTGGAVTQASQTVTVAGVPAQNDTYTVTLQIPYIDPLQTTQNIGVAQTRSITVVAPAAPTVTSVAVQIVNAINADPILSLYYLATNAAGVVTVTAVAGTPFLLSFNFQNSGYGARIALPLSGSAGNGLTVSASKTGAGTITAGGGSLASGAGYFGTIPAWITIN